MSKFHDIFKAVTVLRQAVYRSREFGAKGKTMSVLKASKNLEDILSQAQASDFQKLKEGESMLYVICHLDQMSLVPRHLFTLATVSLRNKFGSCLFDWAAVHGKLDQLPKELCTLDSLMTIHPYSGSSPLENAIWKGFHQQVPFLESNKWALLSPAERGTVIKLVDEMDKKSNEIKNIIPLEVLTLIRADYSHIETRKWEKL